MVVTPRQGTYPSRPRWTRRRLYRTLAWAAVALVVAAAVTVGLVWWLDPERHCTEGVERRGTPAECVGVPDSGTFAFTKDLRDITDRIAQENADVTDEDAKTPYVEVAYLTTLTVRDDDSNSAESVLHELQGAYLAQVRHNAAYSPKIKLILANPGSRSQHWRFTVEKLKARTGGDHPLVAVAGIGPSTDENKAAARALSKAGLALAASTATATDMVAERLVRVAPPNSAQARAAASYLHDEGYDTAALVVDTAKGNLYARTLAEEFARVYPRDTRSRLAERRYVYDSSQEIWGNQMHFLAEALCDERPEVVYFAGRGKQLGHFLTELADRPCRGEQDGAWQNVTVMTGDDTSNLSSAQLAKSADKGVRLLFTGLAHPRMWDDRDDIPDPAREFAPGGRMAEWFPSETHDDGQAMVAHDSVAVIGKALQMARGENGSGEDLPDGKAVAAMFQVMISQKAHGAGGYLSFTEKGTVVDHGIPILELVRREGKSGGDEDQLQGTARLRKVVW
ncbi:type 1 periplasmic-binding domain-containing protein [Streptomyces jeddahensis]|uniref:Uncharacterized protein n=1 Tax=Streptomyces jeddahensis TaxID=1716141 RepID=A0A177HUY2_9ACTN|nr:hypothetical protein [Streptomyces jeddahensis]OAH14024.1 hypothetical protein STSP_27420 [Streptomyces jeddahensis]